MRGQQETQQQETQQQESQHQETQQQGVSNRRASSESQQQARVMLLPDISLEGGGSTSCSCHTHPACAQRWLRVILHSQMSVGGRQGVTLLSHCQPHRRGWLQSTGSFSHILHMHTQTYEPNSFTTALLCSRYKIHVLGKHPSLCRASLFLQ